MPVHMYKYCYCLTNGFATLETAGRDSKSIHELPLFHCIDESWENLGKRNGSSQMEQCMLPILCLFTIFHDIFPGRFGS